MRCALVCCLGILTLIMKFTEGVYFSLTDIAMNLPGKKTDYLPDNHALVTLNALDSSHGERTILPRYAIDKRGHKYLSIFSSTGDIMFSKHFLENNNRVTNVSAKIFVEDGFGGKNTSSFRVNISPHEKLDCDLIIEDLCYWQAAKYRIYENRKPSILGTITSPYLVEMCKGFKINYTVEIGNSEFTLLPPTNQTLAWSLQSVKALDRENITRYSNNSLLPKDGAYVKMVCSVVDLSDTRRELSRNFTIQVLDENDNVPVPQEKSPFYINIDGPYIHKNKMVFRKDLLFIDKDSFAVNKYDIKLLNDTLGLLKPECTIFDNNFQTVIHCKLIFIKEMYMSQPSYSVILQINDTTFIPKYGSGLVKFPIHLHFNNTEESASLTAKSPLLLYPAREVKIFRSAAVFARVIQPDKAQHLVNYTDFSIQVDSLSKGAFNITVDGIVYVANTKAIKKERARLKISWKNGNVTEGVTINVIIMDEPDPTCENSFFHESCSEAQNKNQCDSICGIATGGAPSVVESNLTNKERCVWKGRPKGTSTPTEIYSTCTPDRHTCPDQICDSLEKLDFGICPQDCALPEEINFPMKVNPETKRGIYYATGIVFCDNVGKCSNEIEPPEKKKKTAGPKTTSTSTSTSTTTETVVIINESLTMSNNIPTLNRQVGIDIASCGTKCMLGIAAGALFLVGAVAVVVACWKLDRVHKTTRKKFGGDAPDLNVPLSDYVDRGFVPDTIHLNFDMSGHLGPTVNYINKLAPDPKWEFPRSQLIIEQTLGEGEFGRVLRARAKEINNQPGYTTVAVKTLKDDAREPELADLLQEYQILKEINHPNVIRLLGASTVPGGPVYLIIEFAQFGSLRSYLRRSRHLKSESHLPSSIMRFDGSHRDELYDEPVINEVTPKDILSFAWQICNGMSYLSDIKLVHRDLAARNVLVATGKICKISDFGLTRDIYEDDAYYKRSKGRVPVKWMAPESLSDHIYTNKSDVWSYGILVWELVTLGATPYPGIQVQNLFHLLKSGYRMERPENCSPALYKIMKSCWHIDPEQRPTFADLAVKWEKMLTDIVDYLDLTPNIIHNRSYFCTNGSIEDEEEESVKSPDPSEVSNLMENSSQYIKCGESSKLLNEESQKAMSSPIAVQNETQGYESPIKMKRTDVKTPTNDCPQYYTNMCLESNRPAIIEAS